ncbi:AAA family ATPase [Thiocystis violascens]|uniref:AAA family ATPase n=1 Tax=Thiocystis violascens TaxID=73141 RepID=UPI00022C2245|nr:AAA family ATPase [Thiocystis violascens]
MSDSVFLTRVVLRNYKSIGNCDVRLQPLTFLVGANGSGKSNFLDALHLVRDALAGSLDNALNERGGLSEVRRRSSGHPTHFGIRLEFSLGQGQRGHYAFNIGALSGRCRGADMRFRPRNARSAGWERGLSIRSSAVN